MDKRLKMQQFLCQFTLRYLTFNGDEAVNVIYMRKLVEAAGITDNSPFSDSDAASQAGFIESGWNASLKGVTNQAVGLQNIDWVWNPVQDVGPLHEGTHPVAGGFSAGSVAGEALPMGISKAIEFKTGLGGRGNHGRLFLPGLSLSQVVTTDPDVLTAGAQAAFNSAAAGFLTNTNNNDVIGGAGYVFELVVVSFIHAGALRVLPEVHKITQALIRDGNVDYQRRRSTGHSRHH